MTATFTEIAPAVDARARPAPEPIDFGPVRTAPADLPDAQRSAAAVAQAIADVLVGQRPLTHLTRWASPDVMSQLRHGVEAQLAHPPPGRRARIRVVSVRLASPAPGVLEVCAVLANMRRRRALAFRLEGLDGRWQCTAVQSG